MIVVGIDPGNDGALAFLDTEAATIRIVDMPIYEWETTRTRKKIDGYSIVAELNKQPIHHILMEEVWSSPQMGVVSAFSFGNGRGIIEGVAAGLQIPMSQVKPAKWKKDMKVPADKKAAVQRATQLIPDAGPSFRGPRGGIIDGRAEAALLAFYCCLDLNLSPSGPLKLITDVD